MSTPIHPVASLKVAIRAHLLADVALNAALGTAVYDVPPRGANPPYLVLGDANARENATNDGDGRIIELEVLLFTEERGSRAALTLAAMIEKRLDDAALTLDGHRLISLSFRETLTRHDAAKNLTRIAIRLRAFTEPL
jgi:hypothetical protein